MGNASWKSAVVNLLNTIIGAGMLAMPYAIRSDGILIGLFVIVLSAMTSSFGLYLQGKCSKYTPVGKASFFALAQLTYPQLGVIFDLAILIKCFGVGVSYLVVIGDLMPKIVESLIGDGNELFLKRNFWITIFMIFIVSPLSYLKKMDSLKYASMIALSSVAYLVILVFVHFLRGDIEDKGPVRVFAPLSSTSVLTSFPIFVFAYTCHQNMFTLVNELNTASGKIINKVIMIAIGIAMSLYIVVGITGYISFGDNVEPNVIVGYTQSLSSTIGRIAIVVLVMLSYPLQCHPARLSVSNIIHYFKKFKEISRKPSRVGLLQSSRKVSVSNYIDDSSMSNEMEDDEEIHVPHLSNPAFYTITSVILILSYLVAITVTSLAHVLAIVGSTGSTSISFILPGIFGYQLIGSEFINPANGEYENLPRKTKFLRYASFSLSIWGLLVMIVCLSVTIFLGATH